MPSAAAPVAIFDMYILLKRIRRHRSTAMLFSFAIFAIFVAIISLLTPKYYALTTIMINQREAHVVSFEKVLSDMPGDLETVQSEAQVLQSRELAGRVVDRLELTKVPEFNSLLDDHKLVTAVRRAISQFYAKIVGSKKVDPTPAAIRARAIDILSQIVAVEPLERSRAISISVRADNAALTANIANTIASSYLEQQLAHKVNVSRIANRFLTLQAKEIRTQVQKADQAVAVYRSSANLLQGKDTLITTQELLDRENQLGLVRAKREDAEARERQIAVNPNALPEVMASQLITRLQEQRGQLKANAIEAEASLGPLNAKATQYRAAVADADRQIGREIAKIDDSLRTEAEVQRIHERVIEAQIEGLKQVVGKSYQAEVKMHALEREAEVARVLLQSILTRQQQVSMEEAWQQPDATILSRADVPTDPSFPRPFLFLAVAAIASTGCGCAIAVARDRDGGGLKSMDQVPEFGIKPLGLVPEVPSRASASRYVLDKPDSAFAESLRSVISCIVLPKPDPIVLLVASSVPREGKSSIAISLARLASHMGLRTLLIDGDLRRPTVGQATGLAGAGLSDLLEGRVDRASVVQNDPCGDLKIILAGLRTQDAARLLHSAALREAFAQWRKEYEFIIVDSAPTASVSDAHILATCADEALFIAHWNRTRRELVVAEIERLRATGVPIAGLLLTHVDVRQHALDLYSDSGAFFSYGHEYRNG